MMFQLYIVIFLLLLVLLYYYITTLLYYYIYYYFTITITICIYRVCVCHGQKWWVFTQHVSHLLLRHEVRKADKERSVWWPSNVHQAWKVAMKTWGKGGENMGEPRGKHGFFWVNPGWSRIFPLKVAMKLYRLGSNPPILRQILWTPALIQVTWSGNLRNPHDPWRILTVLLSYGVTWIPSIYTPVMLAFIYQHQPDPSWVMIYNPPNIYDKVSNITQGIKHYPLVMTNIAMENGSFIDGLPIKSGGSFHGYIC